MGWIRSFPERFADQPNAQVRDSEVDKVTGEARALNPMLQQALIVGGIAVVAFFVLKRL